MTGEKIEALAPSLSRENRLVLDICAETGLRVGDVVSLTREAVERSRRNRGWLTVIEQKTRKKRSVRLSEALSGRCMAFGRGKYVFPHRLDKDRHRTREAVWRQLKKVAREKYGENISPHSYRKHYAVRRFRETGDLQKVQREMGHTHLETTLIYAMADVMTETRAKQRKNHKAVG